MFAIIAYFILSLFARLYVKVDIYLTCGKTDHHDIAEILLKVALNTITQGNKQYNNEYFITVISRMWNI